MTFKRIILAIDRIQQGDNVLEQGVDIACKHGAHLTLLHCIADVGIPIAAPASTVSTSPFGAAPTTGLPAGAYMPPAVTDDYFEQYVKSVREWMRQCRQKAYDAGCEDVTMAIRASDAGDCICQLAADTQADLIIIGRKDRSGLEELLLGSVSSYVMHHAPCSVLVMQP